MAKLKSFKISSKLKAKLAEIGIDNAKEEPVTVKPKKRYQAPFGVANRMRRVAVVEQQHEDAKDFDSPSEIINAFRELAGDPKDWLTEAEMQELLGKIEQDLAKNKPNGHVENTNADSGREM